VREHALGWASGVRDPSRNGYSGLHQGFQLHPAGQVILPSRPRRRVARRLTAAGIFLLGLAGCATLQLQALVGSRSAGIPQRAELEAVPFFPQEDYQCGPAALAMVLSAGGKAIEPEVLRPQVYLPDRHGSLQIEMLAATRRNGFVAIELAPSLPDLLAEIAAGNPVVVLQNLALDWYPAWHYAVAIGYDLKARRITLRSGTERRLQMPLDTFEHTWRRSGYWAILAHPQSAAAHNNLAQTLEEFDRHDEALAEAREAVGLGGPLEDVSMRTLDAIVSHAGRGEQEWNQ